MPIAWQGWVVLVVFIALVVGSSVLFADKPLVVMAIVLPATAVLMLIAARTTKGGWRWRMGDDE